MLKFLTFTKDTITSNNKAGCWQRFATTVACNRRASSSLSLRWRYWRPISMPRTSSTNHCAFGHDSIFLSLLDLCSCCHQSFGLTKGMKEEWMKMCVCVCVMWYSKNQFFPRERDEETLSVRATNSCMWSVVWVESTSLCQAKAISLQYKPCLLCFYLIKMQLSV